VAVHKLSCATFCGQGGRVGSLSANVRTFW